MPSHAMDDSFSRPVAVQVQMIEDSVARRLAESRLNKYIRRWSAPAGDTAGREAGDGKRPAVTAGREAGDDKRPAVTAGREAGDDVNAIRFAQGVQSWKYPDDEEATTYKVSYDHTVSSTSLVVFLTGTDGTGLTEAKNPLSKVLQSRGCVLIEPDCSRCNAPKKGKYKAPRGVNVCGR